MTEKLKYKVGDKVLIEGEIEDVDTNDLDSSLSYLVAIRGVSKETFRWVANSEIYTTPKPKITQAVMDYYEKNRIKFLKYDLDHWLGEITSYEEIKAWLFECPTRQESLEHQHALATLITYGPEAVEVEKEKEKKYLVILKSTGQLLARTADGFFFGTDDPYFKDSQYEFTKQELINAGFEGVFGNPVFGVEEVE